MSLITRAAVREHIFKIIFGSEFATGETIEKGQSFISIIFLMRMER